MLDKQIEGYLEKILLTNNIEEIGTYRETIAEILLKKAKIAGELSPAGSHISRTSRKKKKIRRRIK